MPVVSLPCPVIDADHCGRRNFRRAATAHDPKQSVSAHLDLEPPRQGRRRSTAKCDCKATYDFIEARCAPGMGPYSPFKPFDKNSAWAGAFVAEGPPCLQSHFGAPARRGEIGDLTQILAMNTASRGNPSLRPNYYYDLYFPSARSESYNLAQRNPKGTLPTLQFL